MNDNLSRIVSGHRIEPDSECTLVVDIPLGKRTESITVVSHFADTDDAKLGRAVREAVGILDAAECDRVADRLFAGRPYESDRKGLGGLMRAIAAARRAEGGADACLARLEMRRTTTAVRLLHIYESKEHLFGPWKLDVTLKNDSARCVRVALVVRFGNMPQPEAGL